MENPSEFLWAQAYRPKTIDDCILPKNVKSELKGFVKSGKLPHFLFSGGAGTGKTTVAIALCNDVGAEHLYINGSEESGIDTLRTKILSFASSVSLTGAGKYIIVDEADGLQANSTQPALRAAMEATSSNCRFIFTANYKNKLIEPIHSRCTIVDFKIKPEEKPEIAQAFMRRCVHILEDKNIKYEKAAVAGLISKNFPDFRKTLNELQRYSIHGVIDSGVLVALASTYDDLYADLKNREFNLVRKWVGKNKDIDVSPFIREFYEGSSNIIMTESIPELVLLLNEYQTNAAVVADPEINMMAFLTKVMSSCTFKD